MSAVADDLDVVTEAHAVRMGLSRVHSSAAGIRWTLIGELDRDAGRAKVSASNRGNPRDTTSSSAGPRGQKEMSIAVIANCDLRCRCILKVTRRAKIPRKRTPRRYFDSYLAWRMDRL